MGAGGTGIFENDTACDFAEAVADGGGISSVEDALNRILWCGVEYLDASVAAEGLAAAEIVARSNGSPGDKTAYTARIDRWIEVSQPSIGPELIEKAKQAIIRVLSEPSELLELWMPSDKFDRWRRSVEAVLNRLSESDVLGDVQ
jgi:uncharacterized protein DUF4259